MAQHDSGLCLAVAGMFHSCVCAQKPEEFQTRLRGNSGTSQTVHHNISLRILTGFSESTVRWLSGRSLCNIQYIFSYTMHPEALPQLFQLAISVCPVNTTTTAWTEPTRSITLCLDPTGHQLSYSASKKKLESQENLENQKKRQVRKKCIGKNS